jgi:hypothetical protein
MTYNVVLLYGVYDTGILINYLSITANIIIICFYFYYLCILMRLPLPTVVYFLKITLLDAELVVFPNIAGYANWDQGNM